MNTEEMKKTYKNSEGEIVELTYEEYKATPEGELTEVDVAEESSGPNVCTSCEG